MSSKRAATILLADDDEADRIMTRRALRSAGLGNEVLEVANGESLLRAMRGEGEYANRGDVHFVLLDLKMPGMHGIEVLNSIREDPKLSGVPVVVLTGSEEANDIRSAYLAGAASYLAKPVTFDGILRAVRQLEGYSLAIVKE
ncbi:MAG: two-component system response regulator [Bradymonadia bacterium]|jgi:two-component system response regulator